MADDLCSHCRTTHEFGPCPATAGDTLVVIYACRCNLEATALRCNAGTVYRSCSRPGCTDPWHHPEPVATCGCRCHTDASNGS